MSSDDRGPLVLTPDMLQAHVRLVDVRDLSEWDGPYQGDIGAAHTFMGTFGQLQLPVVVDGEVVHGQEFVAAEVRGEQFDGSLAVLDLSDLDWPREKVVAAVLGLDRLKALAQVDAEQLLSVLHEVRQADTAWLAGAGYDSEDLDVLYQQIQRDQEALILSGDGAEGEGGGFESGEDDESMPDKGTLLKLLDVSVADPKREAPSGSVWRLGGHTLVVADVMTGWPQWAPLLAEGVLFVPYPGPFVLLGTKAEQVTMLMVQPLPYLAGHILDKWASIHDEPQRVA